VQVTGFVAGIIIVIRKQMISSNHYRWLVPVPVLNGGHSIWDLTLFHYVFHSVRPHHGIQVNIAVAGLHGQTHAMVLGLALLRC